MMPMKQQQWKSKNKKRKRKLIYGSGKKRAARNIWKENFIFTEKYLFTDASQAKDFIIEFEIKRKISFKCFENSEMQSIERIELKILPIGLIFSYLLACDDDASADALLMSFFFFFCVPLPLWLLFAYTSLSFALHLFDSDAFQS